MQSIYDFLYKNGLLKSGEPNQQLINRSSKRKIFGYIEEILSICKKHEISRENSIFAQSASHSLGGGVDECRSINCRMRRIDSLARYSILYADKVYIDNFFNRYKHYAGQNDAEIQRSFFDDLTLLQHLQPLIERGFIRVFTPKSNICPHCLSYQDDARYLNESQKKRIQEIRQNFLSRYLNETTAIFMKRKGEFAVRVSGPEELYTHGDVIILMKRNYANQLIQENPYLQEEIKTNGQVLLLEETVKKLDLHEKFTNILMSDISFQLLSSNIIGTSFLTENPTSISILSALSGDTEIIKRNLIAEKYLTTIVPFLEDVPLNKMMKIRDREEESLISFRSALNQAIGDYSKDKQFNEFQAKQLYSDVIHPSLMHMEKSFSRAKVDLIRNIGSKIIGTGVALGFGIYTGIIPTDLVGIANALGLINIISDLVQQASGFQNTDKVIKEHNYYFLLKLKKHVSH